MKNSNNQSGTLKKGLFLFIFALIPFICVKAQDKITLKTGEEIFGKVIEINETEIKYKKDVNPDGGPTRLLHKYEVFSIRYQNGTKEFFDYVTKPEPMYIINTEHPIPNKFETDSSDFAKTKQKRFGGPRIGFTYIAPGTSADYLEKQGKQPVITQFGWQFEGRIFTVDGGLSGIVEFIPLIGGFEQGMIIPSASLMIGLRGGVKHSFEFAMGPNFSVVPNYLGHKNASVGLVVAAGTSFIRNNINFPVNIAFIPSVGSKESVLNTDGTRTDKIFQTGWRLSLVVGFNSRKK